MRARVKIMLGWFVLCLSLFSLNVGFVTTVHAQGGSSFFASVGGSGLDCTQAAPCLPQDAIDAADAGDTVYFEGGTYTAGSGPYLRITKPVSLIGGWDGSSTGDVIVDPDTNEVVIDGTGEFLLILVNNTSGTGGLITITGFTLQNGISTYGGAIYIQSGRVEIAGNTFLNNYAHMYGGAIYVRSAEDVQISNNSFDENSSTSVDSSSGGSIYVNLIDAEDGAKTLIEGNVFTGGHAIWGTAIFGENGHLIINANLFKDIGGNSVIHLFSDDFAGSTISNNFIIRATSGNAIYLDGANTTPHEIVNNTIVDVYLSGINLYDADSSAVVVNNIISDTFSSIDGVPDNLSGSNNLFHNNYGDSNLLTDPVEVSNPTGMFVDPSLDDYHLGNESPAVDAGTTVTLTKDFDGDWRPSGGGYDIGADEIQGGVTIYLPLLQK